MAVICMQSSAVQQSLCILSSRIIIIVTWRFVAAEALQLFGNISWSSIVLFLAFLTRQA